MDKREYRDKGIVRGRRGGYTRGFSSGQVTAQALCNGKCHPGVNISSPSNPPGCPCDCHTATIADALQHAILVKDR